MTEFNEDVNDTPEIVSINEARYQWSGYLLDHAVPDAVVLENTNRCPNNCAHCYAKRIIGKNTGDMPRQTFYNWLDVLAEGPSRPTQIWHCGGEPTKNPMLEELAIATREHGIQPMLVTTAEDFSDIDFATRIAPLFDEIDVTIRGFGGMHDLMMLPSDDQRLQTLPTGTSLLRQIHQAKQEAAKSGFDTHFETTICGIKNIYKVVRERGGVTKIGLNVDMQDNADLIQIVRRIVEREGVPIENIILQRQTFPDGHPATTDTPPNSWRQPSTSMVQRYLSQIQEMRETGLYRGKVEIIDALPQRILDDISSLGVNLDDIYNPVATPAISPEGMLRPSVLMGLEES